VIRAFAVAILVASGISVAVIVLPKTLARACYSQEMSEVKTITTVHTAEAQYYLQYGNYAATLTQLGPDGANLIDKDLARGEKAGFKFVLRGTPEGYALGAGPLAFNACGGSHTYFSDQSMTIHQRNGEEPATINDPLLGDPVPLHRQDN